MKFCFIILLFLAFSCSTKKTDKEPSAGESDAKPASPYTVEPCFCMKIFRPVCADGMNYPNSCEAECHGHKTWTEAPCPTKK